MSQLETTGEDIQVNYDICMCMYMCVCVCVTFKNLINCTVQDCENYINHRLIHTLQEIYILKPPPVKSTGFTELIEIVLPLN